MDTSQSARNLGFSSYLMYISHSPTRSLHCVNPAIVTSALFAVSVITLTFTPPKQLPPPSYIQAWLL